MIVSMAADGLHIDSPIVSLGVMRPLINGAEPDKYSFEAVQAGKLRYVIPAVGIFGIEVHETDTTSCALTYWLEGLSEDFELDSFGIQFSGLENLRAYLRNG